MAAMELEAAVDGGCLWRIRVAEMLLLLAAILGQRKRKERERVSRERECESSIGFLVR